jgi:hypothetical protein
MVTQINVLKNIDPVFEIALHDHHVLGIWLHSDNHTTGNSKHSVCQNFVEKMLEQRRKSIEALHVKYERISMFMNTFEDVVCIICVKDTQDEGWLETAKQVAANKHKALTQVSSDGIKLTEDLKSKIVTNLCQEIGPFGQDVFEEACRLFGVRVGGHIERSMIPAFVGYIKHIPKRLQNKLIHTLQSGGKTA